MPTEPIERSPSDNAGWLPYALHHDGARLVFDWCHVENDPFEEPFFDQSIHRILQQKPRARRSTSVDALGALTSTPTPAGFIFHISRCGSTLIARMLASIRAFAVFSEPAILETVLRGRYQNGNPSSEQTQWLLRNVIQALAGPRLDARGALIKFTARAVLDHRAIAQAYPDVPRILVYREPTEVLVSLAGNQRDRLPPGLSEAGLLAENRQTIDAMRPTEFWARVMADQFAVALEMAGGSRPLLVNYSQLPEVVWTVIAKFLGIELSTADIERMRGLLSRNAKDPRKAFIDDREARRAAASDEVHELADRLIRPYYDQLEAIRVAREKEAS